MLQLTLPDGSLQPLRRQIAHTVFGGLLLQAFKFLLRAANVAASPGVLEYSAEAFAEVAQSKTLRPVDLALLTVNLGLQCALH